MNRTRTLRTRLLRTLAVALVLVFVALWLLLVLGIRRISEQQMLMHLEHDGAAVLAAVDFDPQGNARLDPRAIEPVYEQPRSGHYYQIHVDGRDFRRSASLEGVAIAHADSGARADYHERGPGGQQLVVLARSAAVAGRQVAVFVAEDMGETNDDIRRLSAWALLLFLLVLPLALWLQGVAVRRALLPLDELRQRLQEVGMGQHAQVQGEVPLEIKPLVDELNRLLVLLQRRLHQSRTAVGNLAHALKTPLAVLVRSAESPGLADALRTQLQEQTGAIRQRLERELRRARLAGPAAAGAAALFNPAQELAVLVQVLAGIYRDKALDIAVESRDELLPLDREDMLELLGNLADNACKWAASRVRIEAGVAGGEFRIAVADDGPGCSVSEAQAIQGRGVRLDERTAGHGLGLAIVREAVDFYGGRLRIARDARLGGMLVEVVLPLPPSGTSPPA